MWGIHLHGFSIQILRLLSCEPHSGRVCVCGGLFKAEAAKKIKVGRVGGQLPRGQEGRRGLKEPALKDAKPGMMGSDHGLQRELAFSLGMEEVESEEPWLTERQTGLGISEYISWRQKGKILCHVNVQ